MIFMLARRQGQAGWEEFQRKMHNKWKWSDREQGRMMMNQEAHVDNIGPAEINMNGRR